MPETRLEKGVFVLGLVGIAVLVYLVARPSHHAAATPAPVTTRHSSLSSSSVTTATVAETHTAQVTTSAAPTPRPTVVALTLTARGGDSWMEVRDGSSAGPVLYSGILGRGQTKSFRARRLWVRFGGAGNIAARLNGKSVLLPSGTYSAFFDASGIRGLVS